MYEIIEALVGHQPTGPRLPAGAETDKAADQIRVNLLGEHGNISTRVQWNLAMQGFLFAGYAVASKTPMTAQAQRIEWVIPSIGAISCLMTLAGIYAAYSSINSYKRAWLANEDRFRLHGIRPFSGPVTSLIGRIPSVVGPAAILGAWIFLMWGYL